MKLLARTIALVFAASLVSACSGQSVYAPKISRSGAVSEFSCTGCGGTGGSGGGTSGPGEGTGGGGGTGHCMMARNVTTMLGCSNSGSGGGNGTSQVACAGTPSQCANIPCNGSQLSIGSSFQWNGQDITVTDINSLWQSGGGESRQVGWIYQADNGARYIQGDLTSSWGVSFSIDLKLISVGGNSPGAYTPIQHYSGYLPAGTGSSKCETQGQQLA